MDLIIMVHMMRHLVGAQLKHRERADRAMMKCKTVKRDVIGIHY